MDREGKITNYIAIKEDITDRKRMIEELRSVTTIQKAILDSANFSILSTDARGIIQTFNAGAERMLGYSAKEMVGKETPMKIHDLEEVKKRARELSTDMKPGFEVFVAKAAAGMTEEREWTYIRKDGSRFPVLLSVTALLGRDGNITGYLGIGSDITHRKLVEESMAKAKEAAESANRAKSDFLATMSHEIRTPMNAIVGMADLLSETALSAEQKKYVSIFKSAGETLLNLINDILDLSKIESGSITLEKIGFDLYEVVEKAAEVMAVRAHQKRIELVYDIQPDVPRYLSGDPVRLRQVILNLIGNAVKFTEKGEVFLVVEKDSSASVEGALRFLVKDTGIGIPKEALSQLFEKFVQADSSITRKYGGSGLGLSISKKLVELMGGTVSVKSEEGKGSIFSFTARFGVEKKIAASTPAVVDIKGMRALVVDDNATNRMILKQILCRWGAVVTEAEDGDVGLSELRRAKEAGVPYELVLLDCRMPHTSGFEVAACVKKEPQLAGVSMLMLTSDNRSGDIAKCRELGIGGYLIKPLKRSELLEAIRTALGAAEKKVPEVSAPAEEPFEAASAAAPVEKHDAAPTAEAVRTAAAEKPAAVEQIHDDDTAVFKEAEPAPAAVENVRPLKILLVEDSEDNRFLVLAYLKSFPYQVDIAENGVIAVKKFTHGTYDIVFMDMQMPVMDGYTATRTIREWEKQQKTAPGTIIALTAYSFNEDTKKCLDAGCTAYLNKPIKKQKLLETIARYTA
jgi:PAS domain S-box-containing protein